MLQNMYHPLPVLSTLVANMMKGIESEHHKYYSAPNSVSVMFLINLMTVLHNVATVASELSTLK